MDDRDWDMLLAIAEERNITSAAERLFITQSALSYRVKKLEKEFKTTLFIRSQSGVIPTPQCEYLLRYSKNMKTQLNNTKQAIHCMNGTVEGALRIAVTTIFAYYKLPDILKGFIDRYPKVEIFLKADRSICVYEMMQKGEVTLCIIRGDHPWTEEKILISEEPVCLVSSTPLTLDELPKHPQIVQPNSYVNHIARNWWHQHFTVAPYVSMESNNLAICLQMIMRDWGWMVTSPLVMKEYPSLCKQDLYWKDGTPVTRNTWIFCHYSSLELPVVQAFIEYLNRGNIS